MPAVLLIAHAPLASALRSVALHTYPEAAAALAAIDVTPGDDVPAVLARARDAAQALGGGPLLLLADVTGATPANAAAALAAETGSVAVAGVNVPMLWRVLNYRDDKPLAALAECACSGGSAAVQPLGEPAG